MKKLYRKGTVHPSPPTISDQLAFLPATILTLTAALSPEDREVLAYLISCSSSNGATPFTNFSGGNPRRSTQKSGVAKGASAVDGGDHPPLFTCSCFRCYMSYWIRWDSSPNRQLIHEIIDAFEDWLAQSSKNGKNKKEKRNKRDANKQSGEMKRSELMSSGNNMSDESQSVGESSGSGGGGGGGGGGGEGSGEGCGGGGIEDEEKGSVRRFVSFIGERIWGAWGQ